MNKIALVTGATGQDGSYLIEKLLSEGRRVCAMTRRSSTFNMARLSGLKEGVQNNGAELIYCQGDLTDAQVKEVLKIATEYRERLLRQFRCLDR